MKGLLTILAFAIGLLANGQDLPATTEQQLENLADEAVEDDALLQQLSFYQKHPLNLNEAGAEELAQLRLLSALQIQSLVRHRAVLG
ncbi:MAG: hypothetical protein EOO14_24825, partial [Chitinophagaceae bacterium]